VVVMRRMQAAGIDAFGGDVHVLELPAPGTPEQDEVVISVHAAEATRYVESGQKTGNVVLRVSEESFFSPERHSAAKRLHCVSERHDDPTSPAL
jgi:hypothetical protein